MAPSYQAPKVNADDGQRAEGFIYFTDVADAVLGGRKVLLTARGWSMLPMIWDKRDKLLLAPITEDSISVGRLLFVRLSSMRYVLHRVEQVNGNRIVLRGDGNPYQREECDKNEVIAELIVVERDGKIIELGSDTWERYECYWPKNGFIRRCLLFLYRRIFVYKSWTIPSSKSN